MVPCAVRPKNSRFPSIRCGVPWNTLWEQYFLKYSGLTDLLRACEREQSHSTAWAGLSGPHRRPSQGQHTGAWWPHTWHVYVSDCFRGITTSQPVERDVTTAKTAGGRGGEGRKLGPRYGHDGQCSRLCQGEPACSPSWIPLASTLGTRTPGDSLRF